MLNLIPYNAGYNIAIRYKSGDLYTITKTPAGYIINGVMFVTISAALDVIRTGRAANI